MISATPKPRRGSRAESLGARVFRRFLQNRMAVLGVLVLTLITLATLLAPYLTAFSYEQIDLRARSQAPTTAHPLGTDRLGRDVLSRTLYGARISLIVGFAATFVSILIGIVLGALAGFYGGWVDNLIMRLTDVVMTFPPIILMLTLAAFVPRSLLTIVLIIGGLSWPGAVRLVRGQFLSFKEQDFVAAAGALGAGDPRLMFVHVLPNTLPPLVAMASFSVGHAILTEAGLSFLGLGVPPPAPSWGNMLEAARNLEILRELPWAWLPPAVMTVLTVLCVNFIGDGLRDAADPRMVL